MRIAHLTASFMFGGPERQMLGLAEQSRGSIEHSFYSFSEKDCATPFIRQARRERFAARILQHDTPFLFEAKRDLVRELLRRPVDLLLCHGYKSTLVGRWAARFLKIPAVTVCRGWTGASPRVRLYELFDRLQLRKMDAVVCVSHALARQIGQLGVPASRLRVIPNAVRCERFTDGHFGARQRLLKTFRQIPEEAKIIVAAGRLSPEKGFELFVDAASLVKPNYKRSKFLLFGDGPEKANLKKKIESLGLADDFILAGFTDNLDLFLPGCDLFVSSSKTEGLPNVLLEAAATGVPMVATAVGGVPEVIIDGKTGLLVTPGDANAVAQGILRVVSDDHLATNLRKAARNHVEAHFSFDNQVKGYSKLIADLTRIKKPSLPPARGLAA